MNTQERAANAIEIKKIMIERGYKTISGLAKASSINRTTLGKVLDGEIQPSSDVMYKLVDTLQIPADVAGQIFFERNLRNA